MQGAKLPPKQTEAASAYHCGAPLLQQTYVIAKLGLTSELHITVLFSQLFIIALNQDGLLRMHKSNPFTN